MCLERGVEYSMLLWVCCAHQINLTIQYAICQRALKDPVNGDAICGAAVRMYKYIHNSYYEEFSSNLLKFVVGNLRVVPEDPAATMGHCAHVRHLMSLYGPDVVPDQLVLLLNVRIGLVAHSSSAPDGVDLPTLRREVFLQLQKRILLVEEHPTTSRFFTFTACVRSMLLCALFNIPVDVWSLSATRPMQAQQKRIDA
eukprot:2205537-Pyramimonas_sp.AAC.1